VDETSKVREAVLWLREQDRRIYSLPPASKYYIPWELDYIRVLWREEKCPIPSELFGHKILLTGNKKEFKKSQDEILIYIEDLLVLQFMPKDSFDRIMAVYGVFGKCRILRIDGDKELDKLIKYCNSMDAKIVEACDKLRAAGVRDIFDKMWTEVGGDLVRDTDRLGNRIGYFRGVVNSWRDNKPEWNDEMLRLGLLSVK
jgi:hypothetical protein